MVGWGTGWNAGTGGLNSGVPATFAKDGPRLCRAGNGHKVVTEGSA
jgi:hypothetical protein